MNIKIEITLTNDEYTGEGKEIQVQIEEQTPGGFQNLEKWEGIVNYRQMQKDGYLIASTLVEGAANLVVAKRLLATR